MNDITKAQFADFPNVAGRSTFSYSQLLAQLQLDINGGGTFVTDPDGSPVVSGTDFDVDLNVTQLAFESVGPTGSGADHIWTALDLVAVDSSWVELRFQLTGINGPPNFNSLIVVHARETGSSASVGGRTEVATAADRSQSNGTANARSHNAQKIPIDSARRFDVRWSTGFTGLTGINLWLLGYG